MKIKKALSLSLAITLLAMTSSGCEREDIIPATVATGGGIDRIRNVSGSV